MHTTNTPHTRMHITHMHTHTDTLFFLSERNFIALCLAHSLCLSPSVSYLSVFLPVSLCVSLVIRLSLCFCLCLSPSVSVCLCPGQSSSRGLSFQLAMLSFFPFLQISVITRGVFPHHSFPRHVLYIVPMPSFKEKIVLF